MMDKPGTTMAARYGIDPNRDVYFCDPADVVKVRGMLMSLGVQEDELHLFQIRESYDFQAGKLVVWDKTALTGTTLS